MKQRVHLVCNAHLDPVWLWQWEEGAAEAMSTFRTAADLCDEFDGFVFNHNEAILYRWIEEYEPALFRRIRRLVKQGKWHIMGGWYVQPDCNMPSGESFVRQGLLGKAYFKDKFGVDVTTAINFDPFGHSRGLVQILAKSGYDSYIFCRPGQRDCPLPGAEFVWEGFDGSQILATRARGHYSSGGGNAVGKVRDWLVKNPDVPCGLILWGVGDHGGGPSRKDLRDLGRFCARRKGAEVFHSTAAAYSRELARRRGELPVHRDDLNPWAVGCYTSQIRIKQKYRELENELFGAEKMAAAAWAQRRMTWPQAELHEAAYDMLSCAFHDVLPGSSIQPAEQASLRMLDHGLEILSRVKARAFFALAGGQPRAAAGQIPVFVYNPHPHSVSGPVECEFQMADIQSHDVFRQVRVFRGRKRLPAQVEKEHANLPLDWRKRVVFHAELKPGMNRFDCRTHALAAKPRPQLRQRGGKVRFKTGDLDVVVNARTGLVDRLRVAAADARGAFAPLVIKDNADPWGMTVRSFRQVAGRFTLMSPAAAARFAGVSAKTLAPVRVIEDGPVRTVIEVLLSCGHSRICQRYLLPKRGTEIELALSVYWNEKDRMLKLSVPAADRDAEYLGQTAYGAQRLPTNGDEAVAQKWVAVVWRKTNLALTCCNDGTCGSDFSPDGLRLTLLRSPSYSGHPIGDRDIVAGARYTPRIDQGRRQFRFWLNAGPVASRLSAVGREALAKNEKPFALSFFPAGGGKKAAPLVLLDDDAVELAAVKKAEKGSDLIVRLFEPTGRKRSTTLSLPPLKIRKKVTLGPFEIKTLRINPRTRKIVETNLLERRPRPR